MMTLFANSTSPFARKARVVALELGLADKIEEHTVNPFGEAPQLKACNPLSKIPTLVCEDGSVLYDSRVICAYLDDGGRLHPPGNWSTQRRIALADGMMEAAVLIVVEGRRESALQSVAWVERQTAAITRALDVLEGENLTEPLHMGELSIAVALEYLDFRLPELDWRALCPKLTAWHRSVMDRPSLRATRPVAP